MNIFKELKGLLEIRKEQLKIKRKDIKMNQAILNVMNSFLDEQDKFIQVKRIINQNNNFKPSIIYKIVSDQSPFNHETFIISKSDYQKKNQVYLEFLSKIMNKGLEIENLNKILTQSNGFMIFEYTLNEEQTSKKINNQVERFVHFYDIHNELSKLKVKNTNYRKIV